MLSRARCPVNVTMCAGRSASDKIFFFRGRRKASTSAPVIVPWRAVIALMMSRGDRCRVSVSESEIARRFDSPMLSRIAAQQKAAEHPSQAALDSVARLKASRAARPGDKISWTRKFGLVRKGPPGGVLRTTQTASSHTTNRNPKVSHSANTVCADWLMAIFHGTKLDRG